MHSHTLAVTGTQIPQASHVNTLLGLSRPLKVTLIYGQTLFTPLLLKCLIRAVCRSVLCTGVAHKYALHLPIHIPHSAAAERREGVSITHP